MTKNEKWDERNRCLRLETQLLQNSKILWLPPLNIEVSNMIAGYTRLRPWHIKKKLMSPHWRTKGSTCKVMTICKFKAQLKESQWLYLSKIERFKSFWQ